MQEDILVQITNKLRDIRKEKNITLQELAESAGVTKGMLSQVENNRTIPSLTVFLSIIKSLKIDINDFFTDFNKGIESKVIFKKAEQFHPFEKENREGFHYQRILSSIVDDYHLDFVRSRSYRMPKMILYKQTLSNLNTCSKVKWPTLSARNVS